MERKINRVGTGTLTVSLPMKWVRRHNIKKGDIINMQEQNNHMILSASKLRKSEKKVEITIPTLDKFNRRILGLHFRRGCDEIKVNFGDPKILPFIEKYSQVMLGMEIIHQGKGFCVLRNLAEGVSENFESVMKRLIFVTQSMGEELYQVLKSGDLDKIESVRLMEHMANKLDVFSKRIINTSSLHEQEKIGSLYLVGTLLESITDEYQQICYFVMGNKVKFSRQFFAYFKQLLDLYNLFRKVYSKANIANIAEFKKSFVKIRTDCVKLRNTFSKSELYIATILYSISTQLNHASQHVIV